MPTEAEGRPIEQAVRAIAEIQAEGIRETPTSQAGIEHFIRIIARPWLAYALAIFVAAWIAADIVSAYVIGHPFDPARLPCSNSSQRSFPLR